MADKPDGKRWGTPSLGILVAGSIFIAYMSVYYATGSEEMEGEHCFTMSWTYKVGGRELPAWSHDVFSAAKWLDDRLHTAWHSVKLRHR